MKPGAGPATPSRLARLRAALDRLLAGIVMAIVMALTALIVLGALFRYLGQALVWYDEVAAVGLVWLTYYGSALAAARGAHIGFPGLVNALPPALRVAATLFGEACTIFFFVLLARTGLEVFEVLEGDHLVSLPAVPQQLAQSAVPIGAALFILAELLRLPEVLREASGAGFVDHEIKEALGAEAVEPAGERRA